ncbi:hypothetical protein HNY73_011159 [Argiope bruennichi]|uniref:Uncharacterized protein n=1 Tax=Argiope bruennichi TaxID=94029 RepID=A0A8T0F390_ARGBR|nr:hypothetical protein HNY73_011159 [Argiope bruennichi]
MNKQVQDAYFNYPEKYLIRNNRSPIVIEQTLDMSAISLRQIDQYQVSVKQRYLWLQILSYFRRNCT